VLEEEELKDTNKSANSEGNTDSADKTYS